MVIAHLPAGYLLTKLLQQRLRSGALLWVGLLGSVFPDFDILYFYLIDGRQTFHHKYWTHLPFFWLVVGCISLPVIKKIANPQLTCAWVYFLAGVFLHLCLDTMVSAVYWLWPFADDGFQLLPLHIRKVFDFWMWNYLLHPILILELSICGAAFLLWLYQDKKKKILGVS